MIINPYGDPQLDNTMTDNLPGVHEVMQQMRAAIDHYSSNGFPGTRVLIGETYLRTLVSLNKMYGPPGKPEFHLPHGHAGRLYQQAGCTDFPQQAERSRDKLHAHIPLLVFDNHDNPRLDLRYGDGVHDEDIQRVISTILFASRGAALFYYGDEIGMKTTPPNRKEDVKDPIGVTGWPKEKGRDGERTPMQWDASRNAGFTSGTPWLPVPPSAKEINVAAEKDDPNSLFSWYQSLIRLKKTVPSFDHGANIMLDTENTKVLSWSRQCRVRRRCLSALILLTSPKP